MLPGAMDNQTWISVIPQRPLLLEYFPPNKSEMSQNDCTLNVCKCRNSAHTNREHWNPYIEKRNWILVPHHIQNSSQVDEMHKCKIWNRTSNRKKKRGEITHDIGVGVRFLDTTQRVQTTKALLHMILYQVWQGNISPHILGRAIWQLCTR